MKRTLLIALLTWALLPTVCRAQKTATDSLVRLLRTNLPDTSRVLILVEMAYYSTFYSTDSSLTYAQQALDLARQIHFEKGEGRAINVLSRSLRERSKLAEALAYDFQSLHIAKQIKDRKGEALALNNMGVVYMVVRAYRRSLQYHQQSLQIYESLGDTIGMVRELNGLFTLYYRLSLIDSARLVNQRAHSLAGKIPRHENVYKPVILRTSGQLAQRSGDFSEALAYYRLALRAATIEGNLREQLQIQQFIAELFEKINQPDSSLLYARAALKNSHYVLHGGVRSSARLLARLYQGKNQLDSAYHFQGIASVATDSLWSPDKFQQLQLLVLDDQQRQQEQQAKDQAYRSLVKLYTVLGILSVVVLIAFVLYRTNRQKHRANQLLNEQKTRVEQTLETLRTTQAQLIQREKMASLGELTAGIAHEIQNPLNFVNNFSEVSVELTDELTESVRVGDSTTAVELATDLRSNLQRITQNGQRASNIVRGMLEHSRTSTGERQPTDLNALCDEYLRLAYQGLRAKNQDRDGGPFTCKLETHLEPNLPLVSVVSQDLSRVLLNLFNNAFYAVSQKQKTAPADYQPTVSVTTIQANGHVEIRVRDNGMGIPEAIRDKIFQPFFTTKPTGEGTGLGLSLSYDIVTKGHGGMLTVESEMGEGTEFIVKLPPTITAQTGKI